MINILEISNLSHSTLDFRKKLIYKLYATLDPDTNKSILITFLLDSYNIEIKPVSDMSSNHVHQFIIKNTLPKILIRPYSRSTLFGQPKNNVLNAWLNSKSKIFRDKLLSGYVITFFQQIDDGGGSFIISKMREWCGNKYTFNCTHAKLYLLISLQFWNR